MIKPLLALLLVLLLFTNARAQKGGVVYYLTNSGKLVSTKDSSDYSMVVMPPDSAVDKKLYIIYEYDKNGNIRFKSGSFTKDVNLKYHGAYKTYYPDGIIKSAGTYKNGEMTGPQTVYYHNGKLYSMIVYPDPGMPYYDECYDSTGVALAKKGNGLWKQFDEDFTYILAEGKVKKGLQEGQWNFKKSDSTVFIVNYLHGKEVPYTPPNDGHTYVSVERVPSFPGGMESFYRFIIKNVRYPDAARKNNTYGKVIVSFVVEKDGALTDVKVARGIGDGCDEEAVRVIKSSPRWSPGMQDNKPVRVAYSVPIMFGDSK